MTTAIRQSAGSGDCAHSACLTLRFELLDFVGRYSASCGSARDLRSFFGEINQMLDLAGIPFLGPNAFSFFESRTGFFQSNRGAAGNRRVSPHFFLGISCAIQRRIMHCAA